MTSKSIFTKQVGKADFSQTTIENGEVFLIYLGYQQVEGSRFKCLQESAFSNRETPLGEKLNVGAEYRGNSGWISGVAVLAIEKIVSAAQPDRWSGKQPWLHERQG